MAPSPQIPAAEHSTITSWQRDGEVDAYRNMLTQYPTGMVAVVSDSYDIFNACSNLWGGELKEMIEKRSVAPPGCLRRPSLRRWLEPPSFAPSWRDALSLP